MDIYGHGAYWDKAKLLQGVLQEETTKMCHVGLENTEQQHHSWGLHGIVSSM